MAKKEKLGLKETYELVCVNMASNKKIRGMIESKCFSNDGLKFLVESAGFGEIVFNTTHPNEIYPTFKDFLLSFEHPTRCEVCEYGLKLLSPYSINELSSAYRKCGGRFFQSTEEVEDYAKTTSKVEFLYRKRFFRFAQHSWRIMEERFATSSEYIEKYDELYSSVIDKIFVPVVLGDSFSGYSDICGVTEFFIESMPVFSVKNLRKIEELLIKVLIKNSIDTSIIAKNLMQDCFTHYLKQTINVAPMDINILKEYLNVKEFFNGKITSVFSDSKLFSYMLGGLYQCACRKRDTGCVGAAIKAKNINTFKELEERYIIIKEIAFGKVDCVRSIKDMDLFLDGVDGFVYALESRELDKQIVLTEKTRITDRYDLWRFQSRLAALADLYPEVSEERIILRSHQERLKSMCSRLGAQLLIVLDDINSFEELKEAICLVEKDSIKITKEDCVFLKRHLNIENFSEEDIEKLIKAITCPLISICKEKFIPFEVVKKTKNLSFPHHYYGFSETSKNVYTREQAKWLMENLKLDMLKDLMHIYIKNGSKDLAAHFSDVIVESCRIDEAVRISKAIPTYLCEENDNCNIKLQDILTYIN